MLSQLTIFKMSVKYRSDNFCCWNYLSFVVFLLNLINPASIAVVWFCSFMFIFSLFFSKNVLKPTFFPRKFWKMLIVAKFNIIYSDSLISYNTIVGACKNRSFLNNRSVKYMLRVFKTESLRNICKEVYF